MEIHEGNKIIAEFDGWVFTAVSREDEMIFTCNPPIVGGLRCLSLSAMEYHRSWDWLMPVLIKIARESTVELEDNANAPISMEMFNSNTQFTYQYPGASGAFAKENDDSPITALWEFVVEYIQYRSKRER